MNTNEKTFHPTVTPEFIRDCLTYSVSLRFDRMPDNSWQRLVSDKPLSWISDNIQKIISSTLEIKEHTLKDETIRWNNVKHIEVSIELRDDNSTYLFSAEIALEYLDYFLTL